MVRHRIYIDDPANLHEGSLVIGGEEARHAVRVKRLEPGEAVEVVDGAGRVGAGVFTEAERTADGWRAIVRIDEVRTEAGVRPSVVVCTGVPKGSRLDDLIDGLSQAGAEEWRPLTTERAVGRIEEGRKLERLRRIAAEAGKQCGRAWLLRIGEPVSLAAALAAGSDEDVVLADADGEPYAPRGSPTIRLLVGPEGGWTPAELDAARSAGARIARFGPHTMRVETAAVVATGILVHAGRT